MRLIPNSWGSLREYNKCHNKSGEDGGQFCSTPDSAPESAAPKRGKAEPQPQVELGPKSEAFQRWFGDSKVLNDQGDPLVLYHGTTADFDEFDRGKGNVEGDWGAGFYFTNEPADIEANYAGVGPDLDSKITQAAEELAQAYYDGSPEVEEMIHEQLGTEVGDELEDSQVNDAARAIVSKEWMSHQGASMPVYLKIENPAILGGENETRLTFEQETDEDGDIVGEPTGTLIDFADAIRDIASEYSEADAESLVMRLFEEATDWDGVTLSRLSEIIATDERFSYASDDDGKLVSKEIFRRALEQVGYDGIIDYTVDQKFGSQRRVGRSMTGMNPDTVHYIAFRPEQIKSATGNRGTYDPKSPKITEANDPKSRFTAKAQRCHQHVRDSNAKRGKDYNEYAVCTASIGYEGSYRAKHRKRPLSERWSDEARQRSIEVRRARAKRGEGSPDRWSDKYAWLAKHERAMSAEKDRAQRLNFDALVMPSEGDEANGRATYDARRRTGHFEVNPTKSTSRAETASIARHELGHLTDMGDEKRPAAQRVRGRKFSKNYAREISAWKAAIRDAPNNRVRWSTVERGLFSYLLTEPSVKAELDTARALAKQHVEVLKRYGRALRRHDTTPKGV